MRQIAVLILSLALAIPTACNGEESVPAEYAYGPAERQRLDVWRAGNKAAPIILYIHGGGWSRGDKRYTAQPKAEYFLRQGYAFASMNYRLVPDARVEEQAADVARAIGWLSSAAGGDTPKRRIILMGHSAGAHLAALVGTDPSYLRQAGVSMDDVAAIVLLDGAAYHVPSSLGGRQQFIARMRRTAFGDDKARQLRLSPAAHVAAPNVKQWLILYVDRAGAPAQAKMLAEGLGKAGARVQARLIAGSSHMRINRDIGGPGDEATKLVDEFLRRATE